jgi:hypothetical protein
VALLVQLCWPLLLCCMIVSHYAGSCVAAAQTNLRFARQS